MAAPNDQYDVVTMFRALGDPTRLHIFEFLRACCCPVAIDTVGDVRPIVGATAGEVCCHITGETQINSKISHHLKELRLAGLIQMEKHGRHMACRVNERAIEALAAYIRTTPESMPERTSACCGPHCCNI